MALCHLMSHLSLFCLFVCFKEFQGDREFVREIIMQTAEVRFFEKMKLTEMTKEELEEMQQKIKREIESKGKNNKF